MRHRRSALTFRSGCGAQSRRDRRIASGAMKCSHATRAQVLPLFAFAIIPLCGIAALTVDVGYWRYEQRIEQAAADSAATAGAIELSYAGTTAQVTSFARADAATNGFTDDGGVTTSVTVNTPPTSGTYANSTSAVEAIVAKKLPLFFARVFGSNYQWIRARAVARRNASDSPCLITLGGDITMNGGGGGGINSATCGVISDAGITAHGNGTFNSLYLGYVTGSLPSGGTYMEALPAQSIAVPDPCASISSCTYLTNNPPPSPGTPAPAPAMVNGVKTYYPGEYSSTLSPTDGSVLAPGLYILDGGFSAAKNVSGTDVTLYNRAGSMSCGGSDSISLVAPTTGSYAGISVFQPSTNASDVTFNGHAATCDFEGMLYMPSAAMTFDGSAPNLTDLIVSSLTINGGGLTLSTASPLGAALGIGHVVLAE
jgi:hypothetical protein